MPGKPVSRVRYGEAFWRAHHEAWRRSEFNPAGVLRSSGDFAQSVPQLAGEVQSRTPTHGAQAAYRLGSLSHTL